MEKSFQNHKDIVYITGFGHVNDDNFSVFTPQHFGIFVDTNDNFIL